MNMALVAPKLQIEAMLTISPSKMTDPMLTRKVLVANNSLVSDQSFRGCFHVLLHYNKTSQDESGWLVAGLIADSLGKILIHQPILAGRIRGCPGQFEIVTNDGGVRLLEAKMAMSLSQFLDLNEKTKGGLESHLVFWKDIDVEDPRFSPLFYVQVTNFECGGYTVGISCSLLVADSVTKFLKNWAKIHEQMFSKNDLPKLPIYYLPNLKKYASPVKFPLTSSSCQGRGKTMMFKASLGENPSYEASKMAAFKCVEEAEKNIERKMRSGYSFFVTETQESMKIENCLVESERVRSGVRVRCESWEVLGAEEVAFIKGNNPSRVSHWISSISSGVVIAIPSEEDEALCGALNVIVTIVDDQD